MYPKINYNFVDRRSQNEKEICFCGLSKADHSFVKHSFENREIGNKHSFENREIGNKQCSICFSTKNNHQGMLHQFKS